MIQCFNTPIGYLSLTEKDEKLIKIEFGKITDNLLFTTDFLDNCKVQFLEYFAKKRQTFEIPIELNGTKFQVSVWKALSTVPYGTTISYKQLAEMIGNAKASRAVANALRVNPLPIIVPCHRIIGSDGKLTGYAGGLDKKSTLLQIEGAIK